MTTLKDILRDYGMSVAELVEKTAGDETPTVAQIVDEALEEAMEDLKRVLGYD